MNKYLFWHRFYKILGKTHYYENEYGIKAYNKPLFKLSKNYNKIILKAKDILLGFDGLKDEYTLVGKRIDNSPHYDLVKKINNCEDIKNSEYIIREKLGYLDGRDSIKPTNHEEIFKIIKKRLLANEYAPPLVYKLNKEYYALDGKHRLATCCLLGIDCQCMQIDINELKSDKYTNNLYLELKTRLNYEKNIELLEKILMR